MGNNSNRDWNFCSHFEKKNEMTLSNTEVESLVRCIEGTN